MSYKVGRAAVVIEGGGWGDGASPSQR